MATTPDVPKVAGIDRLEMVGRGGFAVVYRGHQPAFRRDVAVKVLQRSGLDADDRRRFERECQALGAISDHPGIVTLHDAGLTDDERPYLIMAYVAGGTLDDRLASAGPMSWQEVTALGVRLAGALETAHRAGVLHRDIKPANVLHADYGDQLSDFGIARIQGGHETKSGVITASVAHAAPEILGGMSPTPQADVYGLASTLYEALAGQAAFARDTDEGLIPLIGRVVSQPVPDLRKRGVPDQLASVIETAMAKEPSQRHPTAEAFGRALREVQADLNQPVTDLVVVGAPLTVTTDTIGGAANQPEESTGPGPVASDETIDYSALRAAPRTTDSDGTSSSGPTKAALTTAAVATLAVLVVGLVIVTRGGDDSEPANQSAGSSAVTEPVGVAGSNAIAPPVEPEPVESAPLETDPVVDAPPESDAPVVDEPTPSDAPVGEEPPAFAYPAGLTDIAADGALASGCSPGSETAPDGVWFVLGSTLSAGSMSLDFQCAYSGAAASTIAQERGDVVTKPIYVINDNQKLRFIDLAADATMLVPPGLAQLAGLETAHSATELEAALSTIAAIEPPPFPMWIYVNDGDLTEVVLQDAAAIQFGSARPTGNNTACTPAQMPTSTILRVTNIAADDPDGGLNIRTGPGVQFQVAATAPNGTTVSFRGGCETPGDGRVWWQVGWTNAGVSGWASSRTLDGKPLFIPGN